MASTDRPQQLHPVNVTPTSYVWASLGRPGDHGSHHPVLAIVVMAIAVVMLIGGLSPTCVVGGRRVDMEARRSSRHLARTGPS